MKEYEARVLLLVSSYETVEANTPEQAAKLAELAATHRLGGPRAEVDVLVAHTDDLHVSE